MKILSHFSQSGYHQENKEQIPDTLVAEKGGSCFEDSLGKS
jgi:hypothetical protein